MPLANGLDWQYQSTQPLATVAGATIKATAIEAPGNEGGGSKLVRESGNGADLLSGYYCVETTTASSS